MEIQSNNLTKLIKIHNITHEKHNTVNLKQANHNKHAFCLDWSKVP